MHKVLNTEPPPPSALSVTVPHAFDALVAKAMAKRPEQRFASAGEFTRALNDAFERKAPVATGPLVSELADADATVVFAPKAGVAPPPVATAAPHVAKKPLPVALLGGGVGALVIAGVAAFLLLGHMSGHGNSPGQAPTAPASVAATAPAATPLTPAQRLATLQSTLSTLPCTFISGTDTAGHSGITGLAGAGAPQAALTAAINSLPASLTPTSAVQTIDGPYCDALDAIRPYHDFFGKPGMVLGLALAGGTSTLQDGQLITVNEKMPAYAGYLQTDYFSGDGTVFHLYPTPTDALKEQPAATTKTLGNPKIGGASWQVSAPYGTDMILSIATTSPLFTALRPPDENASDYLPALREALQNAASSGQHVAVNAIQLVTAPKP